MRTILLITILFIGACEVSTSKNYNIQVEGGQNHEENLKAAPVIANLVWNGNLHHQIQKEVVELQGQDLSNLLGLRYQNMSFSSGEKGVFIQCIFKSSFNDEVGDKVIEICRKEVEAQITDYFTTNKSNQPDTAVASSGV
ncbi:hypothetical protein [Microbulbifer sp. THAF38]|uniref:hypothetical protein n=1 Tax=Microbulbifer sp. THAF38 TaxID=2587856 RepID=UPI0012697448|nr:hypothetical protein [Microbulbifer sp. THAF38]QFT53906.1 hypothetical protein FIU95_04865 [Microbulbifer sp. THAF38]